jgi:hypothetical protein
VLVQIWFAYKFAASQGRMLFIDTRISGLWDDFDNYLISQDSIEVEPVPMQLRVTDTDLHHLNERTTYPRFLQGRLDFMHKEIFLRARIVHKRYRVQRIAFVIDSVIGCMPSEFSWGLCRRFQFLLFFRFIRGRNINIQISKSIDAPLVVQYASGGGHESLNALQLFRFSPSLQLAISKALNVCGDDFDSIHVRNTDIRSDYEALFANVRQRLAGRRVLVCSDDSEVIAAAREQLSASDVFTVTTTEVTNHRPLHKLGSDRSSEQRRQLNFNMFIDLICLSQGRELHVAKSKNGQLSGFSALAQSLHGRADIVQQLMEG